LRTSSGSRSSNVLPPGILLFGLRSATGSIARDSIDELLLKIRDFSHENRVIMQFFDRDALSGEEQLVSALYHALRAGAEKRSRTRDISLDIVRYTAGERQIHVAIEEIGLRPDTTECVCMVFIPDLESRDPEPLLEKIIAFLTDSGLMENEQLEFGREDLMEALERIALVDLKL